VHTEAVESDNGNNVMTIDNETLDRIIGEIVRLAHPDRVILFGSAATDSMTTDSDLDLLVIEPEVSDSRQEGLRLRAALTDTPVPVDVVVMSRERFEETKNVIGGLAYPAHKYGKILYKAESVEHRGLRHTARGL